MRWPMTYSHGSKLFGGLSTWIISQAILMHDPIGLNALWWLALVKNKSFFHPNILRPAINCLVCPCGLPITWHSCSIRPNPIWVLPVSWGKEIPLIFPKLCLVCTTQNTQSIQLITPIYTHNYTYTYTFIWGKARVLQTRKFPRIKFVEINLRDYGDRTRPRSGLVFEVIHN